MKNNAKLFKMVRSRIVPLLTETKTCRGCGDHSTDLLVEQSRLLPAPFRPVPEGEGRCQFALNV
jgi:hypothetical protein